MSTENTALERKKQSTRLHIVIPTWLKNDLDVLAQTKKISVQDYIRDVLKVEVNRVNLERYNRKND